MKVAVLLAAALVVAGCRDGGKEEAEQAVRTYVARVIDAYRTSDASLVDPLVGDQQGTKLLGLIGVKRDAGVVLDARLLELEFTRAARSLRVESSRSWASPKGSRSMTERKISVFSRFPRRVRYAQEGRCIVMTKKCRCPAALRR